MNAFLVPKNVYLSKYRPLGAGDAGGAMPWHPSILSDQLTLSQSGGGGQIMSITSVLSHIDFQTFLRTCLCTNMPRAASWALPTITARQE